MTNTIIFAVVTAYVATGFPCANGKYPTLSRTCAGPRNIPLGTLVHIERVGFRYVEDRTAKKYDGRFDVFLSNKHNAINFGKRTLRVTIYGKQENAFVVK
jgi:3D (Asp-Asp-Asp) domain-containing protein